MKAQQLQKDDIVFFPNGKIGKTEAVIPIDDSIVVTFDCFTVEYANSDELLVGRKGQIL